MPQSLVFIVVGIICLAAVWYLYDMTRTYMRMGKLRNQLAATNPLFCDWPIRCQRVDVGVGRPTRLQSSVMVVTPKEIGVYPKSRNQKEHWTFNTSDLRWFGRTDKYTYGKNEIWLHFETDGRWQTLKVHTYQPSMMALVRALKAVATEEQVIAYRRRRPYIHFGPVSAEPAEQNIHGGWLINDPVKLYLNPMSLVVMEDGAVRRTIPLRDIQKISALKRLDTPDANGLVRFQIQGETVAFASPIHEDFAKMLALAAKRSLEAPLVEKGKKDEEDAFEEVEMIYEATEDKSLELLTAGFVIGDDGEIQIRGE
jgi:hypothetical protein